MGAALGLQSSGGSGLSYVAATQFAVTGMRSFGAPGFRAAAAARFDAADTSASLAGRTFIVTGGNAGLGFATARALARRAADVHLVCRSRERGEAALAALRAEGAAPGSVHLHVADLSSAAAARGFAADWLASGQPIDALVNNAGVLLKARELTAEGLEAGMATALCGSYLLTGLLLPALLRGAAGSGGGAAGGGSGGSGGASAAAAAGRVVNVSSGGGLTVRLDADDLFGARRAYDGTLQYAHAKRAQMELSAMWAARLKGSGVAVLVMHPGWADTPGVQTSIPEFRESNKETLRTPEMGADTIVWLASAPEASVRGEARSGELFFDRAAVPTHFALAGTQISDAARARLWAACGAAMGFSYEGGPEERAVAEARAARRAAAAAAAAEAAPATGGAT